MTTRKWWTVELRFQSVRSDMRLLRTASVTQTEHAGQKMVEHENGDGGLVNVNFEVPDVTRSLVAVGELQKRGMTVVMGPSTWKLRDSGSSDEPAWQQSGHGAFQWRLLDASDKRGERHEYGGSCRPGRCRAHIERPEWAPVSRGYE